MVSENKHYINFNYINFLGFFGNDIWQFIVTWESLQTAGSELLWSKKYFYI